MYVYIHSPRPPPCCGVQSEAHTIQRKLDRAKYAAESIKRLRMSALCVTRSAGKRKKMKTGRRQRYEMPRLLEPEVALLYQKAKAVCLPATWILFHTLAQSVREMYACTHGHAFVCLYFT